MATSDLCNLLSKDTQTQLDPSLERRVCACVLERLDDSSNDVQSIAGEEHFQAVIVYEIPRTTLRCKPRSARV